MLYIYCIIDYIDSVTLTESIYIIYDCLDDCMYPHKLSDKDALDHVMSEVTSPNNSPVNPRGLEKQDGLHGKRAYPPFFVTI